MNSVVKLTLVIAVVGVVGLIVSDLRRFIGHKKAKKQARKTNSANLEKEVWAEKSKILLERLKELRLIAIKEKVNLIEMAYSIDRDFLRLLSAEDVELYYPSLPKEYTEAELYRRVEIEAYMCSTYERFCELYNKGLPFSDDAYWKMLSFLNLSDLNKLDYPKDRDHVKLREAYALKKYREWLNTTATLEEIVRGPYMKDRFSCPEQEYGDSRFAQLYMETIDKTTDPVERLELLERVYCITFSGHFDEEGYYRGCFDEGWHVHKNACANLVNHLDSFDHLIRLGRVYRSWSNIKNRCYSIAEKMFAECKSTHELVKLEWFCNRNDSIKALYLRRLAELSTTTVAVLTS